MDDDEKYLFFGTTEMAKAFLPKIELVV